MMRTTNISVFDTVMAGLVPTIHVLARDGKDVDARDKPGHDEVAGIAP